MEQVSIIFMNQMCLTTEQFEILTYHEIVLRNKKKKLEVLALCKNLFTKIMEFLTSLHSQKNNHNNNSGIFW